MREPGTNNQRVDINYFEGVNATVQQVIARKSELAHMENARAPMIGVLEKRQGQTTIGENIGGNDFLATGNYGVVYYDDGGEESQGLLRVSSVTGTNANIYYLNQDNQWVGIDNDIALGLSLSNCDFTKIDNSLLIVNGVDHNIMITGEVSQFDTEIIDSTSAGSVFNSPIANKAAFYKSRIYLADYYNDSNVRLKTTVLRSSYPMGIVSLVNGDVDEATSTGRWIIPVVDTKYFYNDDGMNYYEIYRGNVKVADITAIVITETDVTASVSFAPTFSSFLSSDEIWVAGTFTGEKQYRWISNSTSTGRDVKQYDTFKLSGGSEDPVTLLEPIGNVLMIANKNAMMTWNDYTLENFDIGVGCSSKNGYVKLKGSLYFMHYSGVYSTSGAVPQLLSRKVEKYLKGATKEGIENSAAGYKGLSVFFTIGDVTLYKNDGSLWKILNEVCLEFNIADQNWYVHTGVTATQFETYIKSDGTERLTMCGIKAGDTEELGDEIITNGTFDQATGGWVLGTGWEYSDNGVTYTA